MLVEVSDRRGRSERVDLRIPVAVADALFSGWTRRTDVAAAGGRWRRSAKASW
jgi:hypothetical protein